MPCRERSCRSACPSADEASLPVRAFRVQQPGIDQQPWEQVASRAGAVAEPDQALSPSRRPFPVSPTLRRSNDPVGRAIRLPVAHGARASR